MKILFLTLASLLVAAAASAQTVVNPAVAKLDFTSADHVAIITPGQVGAGQPAITSYQGSLFLNSADVSTGTPLIVGPVIAKTLALATPTALRLTFAQLGLTAVPPCTVAAPAVCPQYSLVLVAIGPGGTTLRGLGSESDSFTLAPLQPTPLPAAPLGLRIVP